MEETLPLPEGAQTFDPFDYELVGFSGSGGFGTVTKFKNVVTGDICAIKQIDLKDQEYRNVASNEMTILTSLKHENILGCLGLYSAKNEVKILMELMDSDLDNFRTRDDKVLAGIAVKVLNGLKYLKDNKILHLDIKPDNLLCKSGTDIIKIADFGCSVNLSGGEKIVHVTGTRTYGAPEVYCNGGITVSPTSPPSVFACDIFSFGVSMLQLFEGKNKFSLRHTPWSLLNQDRFHLPHFLTEPSEKFQSFLGCCLHKDPMKRSTVEELLVHPFITEC